MTDPYSLPKYATRTMLVNATQLVTIFYYILEPPHFKIECLCSSFSSKPKDEPKNFEDESIKFKQAPDSVLCVYSK